MKIVINFVVADLAQLQHSIQYENEKYDASKEQIPLIWHLIKINNKILAKKKKLNNKIVYWHVRYKIHNYQSLKGVEL